ncbi:hypothetical protein FNV43_RR22256 [Rhamnella rubrinervis]|uniref:Uncharacterized protein n=1 Tax=Rhamnella rubrinervis TaxID=2594499 RepID=A0A8K0DW79_9ROSA|nr:hypothetical protein FNV43_RR22256 [Rhamnella rubrinervis]
MERFMAATASTSQPKAKKETWDKIYVVLQPVNRRRRMEAAENYLGNIMGTAASFPCMETNYKDHEDGSVNAVSQMRDSKKKIIINADEYVKNLKESDEHLERFKRFSTKVRDGEINLVVLHLKNVPNAQ